MHSIQFEPVAKSLWSRWGVCVTREVWPAATVLDITVRARWNVRLSRYRLTDADVWNG